MDRLSCWSDTSSSSDSDFLFEIITTESVIRMKAVSNLIGFLYVVITIQ